MKLPIYDIKIDINDEETFMSCISLVDDAAVEVDFLAFEKEKKPMQFAVSEDKHCITGVAIRADVPIYRYSQEMGEYYVRFTKSTIEDIILKYSKQQLWNSVSLQHNGNNISDAIMIEYYIKTPTKYADGFSEIEDGSLMVTYKILDEELWNTIKNTDSLNGFSIEVFADLQPTNEFVENDADEIEQFIDDALAFEKKKFRKNVVIDDVEKILKKNRQCNITIGMRTLENQQIFQICEDAYGKQSVIVFNPSDNDWYNVSLKGIDKLEITENELVNWDFNAKWKALVADETIGIIDTAIGHVKNNTFEDAIKNKMFVMIDYYDEENEDGKGFRTCFVGSWGYTTGGDGFPKNEALRVYEYNGTSHSGLEGGVGNYRFLLTRRIRDFKIVDYMPPLKTPPIGWVGERQADSGKRGTMSKVKLEAKFMAE